MKLNLNPPAGRIGSFAPLGRSAAVSSLQATSGAIARIVTVSSAGRGERRTDCREIRVCSAIRRTEDTDCARVDAELRIVGNLSNDAPQIRPLDVHVREIRLAVGVAESACGIGEKGDARVSHALCVLIHRALASTPAVNPDHEWMRSCRVWKPDGDVNPRAVDRGREISAARYGLRRLVAGEAWNNG